MITLPPSCLTWLAGQPGPRLFPDSNALLEIKIPRLAVIVEFCFIYIIANTFLRHLKVVFSRSSTLRWRVSAWLFMPGFWSLDPTSQ